MSKAPGDVVLRFPFERCRPGSQGMSVVGGVVHFPIERCAPTLALMRALAPDVREVEGTAESFGIVLPPDRRHAADREMAVRLARMPLPVRPTARAARLQAMLRPLVSAAVAACRLTEVVWELATAGQQRALAAEQSGDLRQAHLVSEADAQTMQAAELLIEAHGLCEAAEGAARAVGFARRGERWFPFDLRSEADLLFASFAASHRPG